jgi:hypothetical protein
VPLAPNKVHTNRSLFFAILFPCTYSRIIISYVLDQLYFQSSFCFQLMVIVIVVIFVLQHKRNLMVLSANVWWPLIGIVFFAHRP